MDKLRIDGPADAAAELAALLEYNGFDYVREQDGVRFLFADRGFQWETVCRCTDDGAVLIYGVYPFPVSDARAALALCSRINGRLRYGGMFLQDDRIVFRTGADLFDIYSAYESIGRAMEYNAGGIVEFWEAVAACRDKPGSSEGNEAQKSEPRP